MHVFMFVVIIACNEFALKSIASMKFYYAVFFIISSTLQNLPQPFVPQNYNIMTPTNRSMPDPGMPVPGPNLMHPGMTPVSESLYTNQPGGPPGAPLPAQVSVSNMLLWKSNIVTDLGPSL